MDGKFTRLDPVVSADLRSSDCSSSPVDAPSSEPSSDTTCSCRAVSAVATCVSGVPDDVLGAGASSSSAGKSGSVNLSSVDGSTGADRDGNKRRHHD
jgi:hypothetical protein